MTTLTEELIATNDDYVGIQVIHVSVFIQPEPIFQEDVTVKTELNTEEKRKLFYKQRLEQINNTLLMSSSAKRWIID